MFKPVVPTEFGTTISRIWTFVLFTMIFRDVHEMSTAKTINEILDGRFEGNPVTDTGLVVGGVVLVVLLLTSLLSTLLTPRVVRRLNLVVAPIALLGTLYLPPNDPDDYLLAGVIVTALLTIIVACWRWRIPGEAHDLSGVRHAL